MLKRIFVTLLVLLTVFIFTGCEIHFADGTRYEVSWWVASLFSVPFLIVGGILIYLNCPKEFWAYCPECEECFYVKKRVFQLTSHSTDVFGFKYKCPCCNKKHICYYKSWEQ